MTFLDRRNGLALSDPVGGKFRILATHDGGRSWAVQPDAGMPDALPGEFAFAASGTCLNTTAKRAWFGTGGVTTLSPPFHGGLSLPCRARNDSVAAGHGCINFRSPIAAIATGPEWPPGDHVRCAAVA